jgi:hypothetical protein
MINDSVWQYGAFVDNAIVYPTDGSPPVKILKKQDAERVLNGYRDNLYRVRRGSQETNLWGGLLANASVKLPSQDLAHARIIGTGVGQRRKMLFWLANNPQKPLVLDPIEVQESDRFACSLSISATDGRGLRGVDAIVRLHFTYEACDYPNGDVLLLIAKNKPIFGLRVTGSGNEHGSAESTLIFPKDNKKGGKPNCVQVIEVVHTNESDDKKQKPKTTTTTKLYQWTGSALVLTK